MKTIYDLLKQGPLVVGEVRGFSSEIAQKFDKSDAKALPITFGVVKINIEQVGSGTPLIVSIYPKQGDEPTALLARLNLERGTLVAVLVGKSESKDGIRKIVTSPDGIHRLDEEETKKLLAA